MASVQEDNKENATQPALDPLILVVIVFISVAASIVLLVTLLKYLKRRENAEQNGNSLTKTKPVELRSQLQELATSGGSSISITAGDSLDFDSERRRVDSQMDGHKDQMQHEVSIHNRVSERLGIKNHRSVDETPFHSEGGGIANFIEED